MKNWLLEEESGQGMVEYGLILALISVVAIGMLGSIGKKIKDQFTTVDQALDVTKASESAN